VGVNRKAIKTSNLPREEIFITTKLAIHQPAYEDALRLRRAWKSSFKLYRHPQSQLMPMDAKIYRSVDGNDLRQQARAGDRSSTKPHHLQNYCAGTAGCQR